MAQQSETAGDWVLPHRGKWSKLIDHYPGADPGNEGDTAGLDLPACLPLFLSLSFYLSTVLTKGEKPQSQHPLLFPRGKDHYNSGFVTERRQERAHLCLNMDGFAQLYEIMCLSEQVGYVCWVGSVESLRTSSLLGLAHVGESFSLRVIRQWPKCLASNYICSESANIHTVLLVSHSWMRATQEPAQNVLAKRSRVISAVLMCSAYSDVSKMSFKENFIWKTFVAHNHLINNFKICMHCKSLTS